jgi:hypothetical protein
MDAWTDDQLKKMKLGGNKRLNDFFAENDIDKFTPITEKYNSKAAQVLAPLNSSHDSFPKISANLTKEDEFKVYKFQRILAGFQRNDQG